MSGSGAEQLRCLHSQQQNPVMGCTGGLPELGQRRGEPRAAGDWWDLGGVRSSGSQVPPAPPPPVKEAPGEWQQAGAPPTRQTDML